LLFEILFFNRSGYYFFPLFFLVEELDGTRNLDAGNRPKRPIVDRSSAEFLAEGARSEAPLADEITDDITLDTLLLAEVVSSGNNGTRSAEGGEQALREDGAARSGGAGVQVAEGARTDEPPVSDAEESALQIRTTTARIQLPDGIDLIATPVPLIETAKTRKSDFGDEVTHFLLKREND
jgi:hypothetical protein